MKTSKGILLCVFVVLGSALLLQAQDPPNFGFVPNLGQASVSKVLLNGTPPLEVARYWTAPRYQQSISNPLAAVFGVTEGPFPVQPADWRTNRVAMDPEGNAWVLNTGSDCFALGVKKSYLGSLGIQGTVVRIQGDTTGLANTSGSPGDIKEFGTDDAVQVFAVGLPDQIPRALIFDNDGSLWIGFHMAAPNQNGYWQKFAYDPCASGGPTLAPVGTPVGGLDALGNTWDLAPYNAAIDKNGILWFSSYGSGTVGRTTGAYACDHGVYCFDTTAASPAVIRYSLLPSTYGAGYGILIDNDDPIKVYATSLDGSADRLWIWDSALPQPATGFVPVTVTGLSGGRSMAFDENGVIWIASSGNGKVCWYDPISLTSGASVQLTTSPMGPVGIGRDDAGYMWAVLRTTNAIARFSPEIPGGVDEAADFTYVTVGTTPYAYGDFTRTPVFYSICGYKYKWGTSPLSGLAGWEIILEKKDGDSWIEQDRVTTGDGTSDPLGQYCFDELKAGDYRITENIGPWPGWVQKIPDPAGADGGAYYITLGPTDPCDPPPVVSYDFINQEPCDETAWAKGGASTCFTGLGFSNWGWSNLITAPGGYDLPLWAGAGKCDTGKGTLVGSVHVDYDGTTATVTFEIDDEYIEVETHLYVGLDPIPESQNGKPTVAPGQFPPHQGTYTITAPFYVLAHAVVASTDFCPQVPKPPRVKEDKK